MLHAAMSLSLLLHRRELLGAEGLGNGDSDGLFIVTCLGRGDMPRASDLEGRKYLISRKEWRSGKDGFQEMKE